MKNVSFSVANPQTLQMYSLFKDYTNLLRIPHLSPPVAMYMYDGLATLIALISSYKNKKASIR